MTVSLILLPRLFCSGKLRQRRIDGSLVLVQRSRSLQSRSPAHGYKHVNLGISVRYGIVHLFLVQLAACFLCTLLLMHLIFFGDCGTLEVAGKKFLVLKNVC
jgi:hypothetical protein